MKVTIEIPEKFIEIAKGIILGMCTKAEHEQQIIAIAEKAKATKEPMLLELACIYDKEQNPAEYLNFNIALAAAALHAMIKESEKGQETLGLAQRLEAMQKQAEELQTS